MRGRHSVASLGVARAAKIATLVGLTVACGEDPISPSRRAGAEVSEWPTWVLPAANTVRPSPPPARGSAEERAEIDEILRRQASRTSATDSLIRAWSGDPGALWSQRAMERLDFYWPLLPDVRIATPVRASRIMALLHVAIYDATVAAWDAKYVHRRLAPSRTDSRVRALALVNDTPSYPSEHAAVAAAAAMILSYAFPLDDTVAFTRVAREAAESRITAGAAYPSDVTAGWALGAAVARRVLDRAMTDGAAQVWTGTVPTGAGKWQPTPPRRVQIPFDALAGTWRTWIIPAGNAFRLDAPPAVGSTRFTEDLNELLTLAKGNRTSQQIDRARYWATEAPSLRWELFIEDELQTHRLSVPHSARARAYLSATMYDAFVACWDSKFAYWVARPVTMDPTLVTVFSTPPFPSYPSGHSTQSSAAAEVMAELFPDRAAHYRELGEQASLSRVWAGVHYRFDVLGGEALGMKVGTAVVARMQGDGVR
ncbi:MAG TPA: phosphatase PAP2 family protein [Gemmatimonadaceae bacterium]|nr:phosphatase PAP2 family protein [Gemmatimonadaceae bacterium]